MFCHSKQCSYEPFMCLDLVLTRFWFFALCSEMGHVLRSGEMAHTHTQKYITIITMMHRHCFKTKKAASTITKSDQGRGGGTNYFSLCIKVDSGQVVTLIFKKNCSLMPQENKHARLSVWWRIFSHPYNVSSFHRKTIPLFKKKNLIFWTLTDLCSERRQLCDEYWLSSKKSHRSNAYPHLVFRRRGGELIGARRGSSGRIDPCPTPSLKKHTVKGHPLTVITMSQKLACSKKLSKFHQS